MGTAVCYAASAGHLFQTSLSALQAARRLGATTPVYVVFVTDSAGGAAEAAAFEPVLAASGVQLLRLGRSALSGRHPTLARYYVDLVLPDEVERVVYLDGDTQVIGDIAPLTQVIPPIDGLAACPDPMMLLRRVDRLQRMRIDRWWASAGITGRAREHYVNSGMLVVDRSFLGELRSRVVDHVDRHPHLPFPDQDALNVVLAGRVRLLSTAWNFPGFLLDTVAEQIVSPRVLHFMSRPRPWNAVLPPWGAPFHAPYAQLAEDHPGLAPYWSRFGRAATLRYSAQQAVKAATERRILARPAAGETMLDIEGRTSLRPRDPAPS